MPDDCPRCERPLTEDGHLRYCDRCGYEPPESANLPVTPPTEEDRGETPELDNPSLAERAMSAPRGGR